jgi:hypothetical protein
MSASNEDLDAAESRIGYNNNNLYNLPNGYANTGNRLLNLASSSVNDKSTEATTGLGSDDIGQGIGYLDYFQTDSAGLTGFGLRRRLALQRALRRRNGALAAAAGTTDTAGALGSLGSLGGNAATDLTGAGGALGTAGLTGLNDRGQGLLGLGSSGYGVGHSGYGYEPVISGYGLGPSQQCKSGINPLLALLTLAIAAAGFYFIYTKLTSITGRKKRDLFEFYLDSIADTVFRGALRFPGSRLLEASF